MVKVQNLQTTTHTLTLNGIERLFYKKSIDFYRTELFKKKNPLKIRNSKLKVKCLLRLVKFQESRDKFAVQ